MPTTKYHHTQSPRTSIYWLLRVLRLFASDLTFSAPVATASAALSLASAALSLAPAAAFLTAGAALVPPRTLRRMASTEKRRAAAPPAISGTDLMASMGSRWAMVRKRL